MFDGGTTLPEEHLVKAQGPLVFTVTVDAYQAGEERVKQSVARSIWKHLHAAFRRGTVLRFPGRQGDQIRARRAWFRRYSVAKIGGAGRRRGPTKRLTSCGAG